MFSTSRYFRSYLLSSESSTAFRPLPSDNSVGIVTKLCEGRRSNQISTPGNGKILFFISEGARLAVEPFQLDDLSEGKVVEA
jgi:hypothetical protein